MLIKYLPVAILLSITYSLPLLADSSVYSWRNSSGQLQFSDRPPANNPPSLRQLDLENSSLISIPAVKPIKQAPTPPNSTKPIDGKKNSPSTADVTRSKRCHRYTQHLRKLRSRLKAGYTARQAPRLLNRERELKDKLFQECREKL